MRALLPGIGVLLCLSIVSEGLRAAASSTDDSRLEQLYNEAKALQVQGDLAGAAAGYRKMIEADPHVAVAYNNLGSLYVRMGDYPKAVVVLEKGLKVNPNMPSATALLGIALFEMGSYGEARGPLESAVRANGEDRNAAMMLVNDLTKLGEFEAAAQQLEKLAKQQPSNPQVWYLLGKVYIQLSENALGKVNEIDPNSVWAHEIASEMAEGVKNYDGAVLEMKKAIETAPRQPGLHYKLGDLYRVMQQWDAAYSEFEAELKADPHNCRAQWKTGDVLLLKNERQEEALSDIDKALAACPDFPEARLDRARLLIKLGRNEDAVPELLASMKATPGEPSIHFLLAQAYRGLGRTQEAQSEMKLFATMDTAARAATAERAKEAIQSKSPKE